MKKSKTIIKAEKVKKVFKTGGRELIAVNEVSFEVHDGEFLAIIGRSGSGKSTLLYQLGLLDIPTSGSIYINGQDTIKLKDAERTRFRLLELGYVFQDYALMPSLSAMDNVLLPIIMTGVPTPKAEKVAIESLERVGLASKHNNLPSQLSGGEQQRVSIARAIAHKPKILFADEPTANLDSETSLLITKLFQELNKQGQTIVMVTHETDYTNVAQRVIKLADGVIVFDKKI